MDKGKKAFNGRINVSRTRSGCLYCKKRKLKCDERKPQCKRCVDNEEECSYNLRLTWPDGAKFRGNGIQCSLVRLDDTVKKRSTRLKHATGDVRQRTLKRHQGMFLNTTLDDFAYIYGSTHRKALAWSQGCKVKINEQSTSPCLSTMTASLTIESPQKPLAPLSLSSSDSRILEFYINRMCATSSLLDGKNNGYRSVILPQSMQSPVIMSALLAVSANHMKLRERTYGVTALHYRELSLKALRRIIASDLQNTSKLDIVVAIMMMCYFDISDGCRSNWMNHLRGAYRIMAHDYGVPQSATKLAIPPFISQYFAAHSIMGYTAVSEPELEDMLLHSSTFWLGHIDRADQEIDYVLGCSKELMGVILRITHRVRQHKKFPVVPADLRWKEDMERKLKLVKQTVPDLLPDQAADVASYHAIGKLTRTAEAFCQATLLILQYLDPSAEALATIQQCTRSILDIMKSSPVCPEGERTSALWPLFIAACHVTKDSDRLFVLGRFSEMEMPERFGNIKPARKVIEYVWKTRDLMADMSPGRMARLGGRIPLGRCFEWEDAMVALGYTLSLT